MELVRRSAGHLPWSTTLATHAAARHTLATHAGDLCVLWLSLVPPGLTWMRACQSPHPPPTPTPAVICSGDATTRDAPRGYNLIYHMYMYLYQWFCATCDVRVRTHTSVNRERASYHF